MADFIPSRYYQIPELFQSQRIPIDVAFVQITAPDRAGFCSLEDDAPSAEFSILVDESYQNLGIGPHLCRLLIPLARERQIRAFTADVLSHNQKMLRMVSKIGWRVKARFENGIYRLYIDLG